ncbi:hypothetical protein GOP47_0001752 [Adiantum capillus-veneris]|uniref:Uncharacterized protein n=1 Tax=Adiantum capillus-veneris TaxID=13818 RepID=A0A9D4V9J4_ADICA|nr:hypothetical protein GOP47_0001752 [Adiantum capillus-veneris]
MAMELSPALPVSQATCGTTLPFASRGCRSLAMAALAENNNKPSVTSSSSSSSPGIPKLEPFNRSRVSRLMKEPSLLEKAEHAISDRCSILEGDEAYQCWEALFEFENMKEEYTGQCNIAPATERQTACGPLERLESFVRQSGGVASLINNVRVLAMANEMRKASNATAQEVSHVASIDVTNGNVEAEKAHFFPEPGELPPSKEDLELEQSAMMPESQFTRVLRAVGIPAPWFGKPSG